MNITEDFESYTVPLKIRFRCKVCGMIYETNELNDVSLLNVVKLTNDCCYPSNLEKVK